MLQIQRLVSRSCKSPNNPAIYTNKLPSYVSTSGVAVFPCYDVRHNELIQLWIFHQWHEANFWSFSNFQNDSLTKVLKGD